MKTIIINNIKEMQKYYNKNTDTYEFIEDGLFLNVEFTSKIDVMSNIKARDIKAWDIKARDINYYAVCFAYKNIVCNSIIGNRENSRHFVLDGELRIKKEEE